jgi:hypothetical protein
MRHYSNIKARYVWRILHSNNRNGEVLADPDAMVVIDRDKNHINPEPLNQNHLGQPFFTDRDLAYQKLDHWMTTHEADADFVLIEIVSRKK